jgi:hypothetical protein
MKTKVIILAIAALMIGCVPPPTLTTLGLNKERYSPNIDLADVADFREQTIIFQPISAIKESNYKTFYYLSEDGSISYTLYNSSRSVQQPLTSFFWGAMEKAFKSIGLGIDTYPLKNVPAVNLRMLALSDEQVDLQVTLLRNGHLIMQKEIRIQQKMQPTSVIPELERRQYAFIDLMVTTILNDSDFKASFFSDQGMI